MKSSSTTGEVVPHGEYVYIANSHIRSGIDFDLMKAKPMDSLEVVEIRKLTLTHNY